MSEETNQKENSSKKGFIEQFETERQDWTSIVSGIARRFKVIEDMAEVQIDLYSNRQNVVEYTHRLGVLQSRLKKTYESEWKKAYDDLALNQDFRYNERERAKFATEKASDHKLKIDVVQSHIDFLKDTTKTIDNMIFGVKHRIDVEDYKRGLK